MRNTLAKALFIAFLTPAAWAQGFIENPPNLGTESGIGVISGFHCSSRDISFRINGNSIGKAGAGTDRGDTQHCADAPTQVFHCFSTSICWHLAHTL